MSRQWHLRRHASRSEARSRRAAKGPGAPAGANKPSTPGVGAGKPGKIAPCPAWPTGGGSGGNGAPRPPGGNLRIDNANGRTRVVGEDRGDIEIQLTKAARAESVEQARQLVESIRVVPNEDAPGDLNLDVEIPGRWNRRGRVDMEPDSQLDAEVVREGHSADSRARCLHYCYELGLR